MIIPQKRDKKPKYSIILETKKGLNFFYLCFLTKGAPLIVEDTAVLRSLAFSRIKLCRIGGMLSYVLLSASILAFTCTIDFGNGGNPFISYSQYVSSVWKLGNSKTL